MNLGISSYSFTWAVGVPRHLPPVPITELNLLEYAGELGVKLLQIADNMPLHTFSDERMENLIKNASRLNIEIEVGSSNMTPGNLERYLTISEKLKSKILRFVIDGKDYKPELNKIISIIRNAEPEFKKRGIILALENHDRLFTYEFVEIIEKIGSDYVGICLDCANSIGAGEGFREVVTALAPYSVNFHLKEVLIKRKFHMMGYDVEGRPFGEGTLPLEWMLRQLTPKCKSAILEQWTPPESTIRETIDKEYRWAKQSIAFLRTYIKD